MDVVITNSNDMEHLTSWQVYVFYLKIFPIYIKQNLMLIVHFYFNIINTIIT